MPYIGSAIQNVNTRSAVDHQQLLGSMADTTIQSGYSTFFVNYSPGNVTVSVAGVQISHENYIATNGTDVRILNSAVTINANDAVEITGFNVPTSQVLERTNVNITGGTISNVDFVGANNTQLSVGLPIVDGSGNTVISESNGKVTLNNTTLGDSIVPNSSFMFRNKIINGGMKISQRGTSFAFAHDGTINGYTLDRFFLDLYNTPDQYDCTVSQYSMSATEISATGHTKALKLLTGNTGAETEVAADEFFRFYYIAEGQDVQDFLHGTTSAKTATLSFWTKSSVTGTFGLGIYRPVSSGNARMINLSYTINAVDTWEKKTILIVGDTGGATIPNDNTAGLYINWQLASGSDWYSGASTSWGDYATTRLMGNHSNALITTNNANWYLTGVQLEIGTVATPFEHRPISMELSLCQRYYQKIQYKQYWGNSGFGRIRQNTGRPHIMITLLQEMRDIPNEVTIPPIGSTAGKITFLVNEGYPSLHGRLEDYYETPTTVEFQFIEFSSLGSQNQVSWAYVTGGPVAFRFGAEL